MIAVFIGLLGIQGAVGCEVIAADQASQRPVTLEGEVLVEHRHGRVMLGRFGCGDQIISLAWEPASLAGRTAAFRSDLASVDQALVERAILGPTWTGLRVSVSGTLNRDGVITNLIVEDAEVVGNSHTFEAWE